VFRKEREKIRELSPSATSFTEACMLPVGRKIKTIIIEVMGTAEMGRRLKEPEKRHCKWASGYSNAKMKSADMMNGCAGSFY
jgi:hypothetical protein